MEEENIKFEDNIVNEEKPKKRKRRIFLIVSLILALLVGGIITVIKIEENKQKELERLKRTVEYLTGTQVQYEEDKKGQRLLFGFLNADKEEIPAVATVNITITNDKGEKVYNAPSVITSMDFSTWSNTFTGSKYLASVLIKDKDIKSGSSSKGTISFAISGNDFAFDTKTLKVDNLPFKANATLKLPNLPCSVSNLSYNGSKYTTFKITDLDYEFEERYDGKLDLTIKYSGEKTYDYERSTNYCAFAWKLYKDNKVVDSGSGYVDKLKVGEKSTEQKIYIWDLTEGDYRIEFMND